MLDFHTHILHNIDDGASDLEMAVEMLEQAYASGTEVVVLSPHYYPRLEKGLELFLDNRARRYDELKRACQGRNVPQLKLAAEVNVCTQFADFERIRELCIEGTDYMLVEMPFVPWEEWMIECVYNLTVKGIMPIMVHIDRYMHYPKIALSALDQLHPAYQVSSEALLSHYDRKRVLELFKTKKIHILGSDMHNLTIRKNTMSEAYRYLNEHFGKEYTGYIVDNGYRVLNNRPVQAPDLLPKTQKSPLFI